MLMPHLSVWHKVTVVHIIKCYVVCVSNKMVMWGIFPLVLGKLMELLT